MCKTSKIRTARFMLRSRRCLRLLPKLLARDVPGGFVEIQMFQLLFDLSFSRAKQFSCRAGFAHIGAQNRPQALLQGLQFLRHFFSHGRHRSNRIRQSMNTPGIMRGQGQVMPGLTRLNPLSRRVESAAFGAQVFQPAGSQDFPVLCSQRTGGWKAAFTRRQECLRHI